MEQHDFLQGSPEWHAHRASHFNASDAPAMLGISPHKTRNQLLKEFATGDTPEVDEATQRRFDDGHRYEELARPIAEKIVGRRLYPVVGSDGKYSASFDGLTMDEEINFEHKSLNDELRRVFENDDPLPELYTVQMEHQHMVSGASKTLFMASKWDADGNLLEEHHRWYEPDTELRTRILAAWEQFEADVDNYQHVEEAPKPEGRAPDQLPSLHVELTGMVTHSNLTEFKSHALAVIGAINRDLKTDEDFSNAEKTVKWCSEVESRLKATKEHALGQTKSIDELFRTIDAIRDETRKTRLELDKLVKARKDAMRAEILQGGKNALAEHISGLNERIGKPYMPDIPADFASAMKGKKTISSLRDAVDTTLAHAKIEANQVADRITLNLKELQVLAHAHIFLFSDLRQIVTKPQEDFVALVKLRIAEHAQAEAKRLEAERARIAAEERDRVAREERERIAAEEREKIAAEQSAQAQRAQEEEPLAPEERAKAAQESTGNDAEATHADDVRDQRPQAPASSTHPKRPTDNEIVAVIANEYGVSMEVAWTWLENFGQEAVA